MMGEGTSDVLQPAIGGGNDEYIPPETTDYSSISQYRDPNLITTCKAGEQALCLYRGGPRKFEVDITRGADAAGILQVKWHFDSTLCVDPDHALWCRVAITSCDKQVGYQYYQCTDYLPENLSNEGTATSPDGSQLTTAESQASFSSPKWNMDSGPQSEWKNAELIALFVGVFFAVIAVFAFWRFWHRYKHFGSFKFHPEDPTKRGDGQEGALFNDPRHNVNQNDPKNASFMRNFFGMKASHEHGIVDERAKRKHLEKESGEAVKVDDEFVFLLCLSTVCCCLVKSGDRRGKDNGAAGGVEGPRRGAAGEDGPIGGFFPPSPLGSRRNSRTRAGPGKEQGASAGGEPSESSFGSNVPAATKKWVQQLWNNSSIHWFHRTGLGQRPCRPYEYDVDKPKKQLKGKVGREIPAKEVGAVKVLRGWLSERRGGTSMGEISPEREVPVVTRVPGGYYEDFVGPEDYHAVPMSHAGSPKMAAYSPGGVMGYMSSSPGGGSPSPSPLARAVEKSDLVVEELAATRKDLLFVSPGEDRESDGGLEKMVYLPQQDPEVARMQALDAAAKAKIAAGNRDHELMETFVSSDVSFDSRGGWKSPDVTTGVVGGGKWGSGRNSYRVEKIAAKLHEREERKREKRREFEARVHRQQQQAEEIQRNRINLNRERRELAEAQVAGFSMHQTNRGSFRRAPPPKDLEEQGYGVGYPGVAPASPYHAGQTPQHGRVGLGYAIRPDDRSVGDHGESSQRELASRAVERVLEGGNAPPLLLSRGARVAEQEFKVSAEMQKALNRGSSSSDRASVGGAMGVGTDRYDLVRHGDYSLPIVERGGRAAWQIPEDLRFERPKKSFWEDRSPAQIASLFLPTELGLVADPKRMKKLTEDELFTYEKQNYAAAKQIQRSQELASQISKQETERSKLHKGRKNLADAKTKREVFDYQHVFQNFNLFNMRAERKPDREPINSKRREKALRKEEAEEAEARNRPAPHYEWEKVGSYVNDRETVAKRWHRVREEACNHQEHGMKKDLQDRERARMGVLERFRKQYGEEADAVKQRGFLWPRKVPELHEQWAEEDPGMLAETVEYHPEGGYNSSLYVDYDRSTVL